MCGTMLEFNQTAKNNIILTGMPGSGKSTVGVILAKELCMEFIDTDVIIQAEENMSLQEIVDNRGLEELLALEERTVTKLAVTSTVIAPGGSVVLSETAMKSLKKSGIIVFLNVPIEIIIHRIDMYIRDNKTARRYTRRCLAETRTPVPLLYRCTG